MLRVPTWIARRDGGWSLIAPCYKDGRPITNFQCLLGSVEPVGPDGRHHWRRVAPDRSWWPYPYWRATGEEWGRVASMDRAMAMVEKGLTRGKAVRPTISSTASSTAG
jgi:hypothetical protein